MNIALAEFFHLLPEIWVLSMACVVLVLDLFLNERSRVVSYWLAQVTLVGALGLTLAVGSGESLVLMNGTFVADPMATLLKSFIYIVTFGAFVYARGYLLDRALFKGEYYVLGLFGMLGMMVMVSAANFLTIYLGLELLSLSLYALVAFNRDDARATEAAMKYFVLGALASGMLLYGLSILYGLTGSLEIAVVESAIAVFLAGFALSALALAATVLVLLTRQEPLRPVVTPAHLHDLGKLLFAFVMVWAYFSFSQLLFVWAGNLPEEIPWYLRRLEGGWRFVGIAVALGQFALPFVLLLSRSTKRDPRILPRIALLAIVFRFVDVSFMIVPAFEGPGRPIVLLSALLALALGGLWLAAFFRRLRQHPLLPVNDPHLEEALAHGRH